MKLPKAKKIIRSRRVSIARYEYCLVEYKKAIYDAIEQAAADYPCINDKFNIEIPVSDEPLLSDELSENLPVKITDALPLSELPVQYLKSDIYQLQEELKLLNKILLIVDTELEKLSIP